MGFMRGLANLGTLGRVYFPKRGLQNVVLRVWIRNSILLKQKTKEKIFNCYHEG